MCRNSYACLITALLIVTVGNYQRSNASMGSARPPHGRCEVRLPFTTPPECLGRPYNFNMDNIPPLQSLTSASSLGSKSTPSGISLEPFPRNPPDQNQYLAFKIKADWLIGYIRVRFPENINSKMGLHFLDILDPAQPCVSEVNLPVWTTNLATGELSYEVRIREGIDFCGRVHVEGEVIHMTFTVANRTGETQDITSQVCCDLSQAIGLNESATLDHTFTWIDGKYQCLANTTSPHALAKFKRLNYNWLLMLYDEQPDDPMRKIEEACPWWIVDQKPDYPILVRDTLDRKHLVAISWGKSTVRRLMTNTNIPCLHTDPLECTNLLNGQSHTWKGRIFMLENNPRKLLHLFTSGD